MKNSLSSFQIQLQLAQSTPRDAVRVEQGAFLAEGKSSALVVNPRGGNLQIVETVLPPQPICLPASSPSFVSNARASGTADVSTECPTVVTLQVRMPENNAKLFDRL